MRLILSTFLFLVSFLSNGQILKPIEWRHEISSESPSIGDEVEVIFRAEIESNWYLYSSDFDPDLGPMVTTFEFESPEGYRLIGDILPINPQTKYDSIFEGDYTYFKKKAEFRQKIKLEEGPVTIKGTYSYQVCSDIDGKCIPFDDDFEIPVQLAGLTASDESQETPFGLPLGTPGQQILEPASWSFQLSNSDFKVGDEVELVFLADIDENWYLYSSDFDPDLGPTVTTFSFEENETYEIIGDIIPVGARQKYDSIFEGDYTYFKGKGEFRQKVKILDESFSIRGFIDYQVCSDIDGKCIPFEQDFAFGEATSEVLADVADKPEVSSLSLTERDSNSPYSLLAFLGFAFIAGLAALLTPCVFPMIPVTVTYFTKSAENGKGKNLAIIYGLAIVILYTVIGVGVSFLFGAEVANDLATSATANLIFFAVFVIFGLSFLGLFEINLPSSWLTKVDSQADRGGLIGVIFMALTLCLVSFSCTGPIVGSILVESAGGAFLKPIVGMFGFSMAFAIPFTLFAYFPGALSKIPKSGGWLNSVKVVLGFIELALSLKFLSIVDQVYHWGILDREVFLAIWIIILIMMGFYLLGKIQLKGDDEISSVSIPRLLFAIATFSFVAYLIPGMFGAPLKALAGYLPPMTTHDFDVPSMIRSYQSDLAGGENRQLCDEPLHADILEFPHGIKGYFDYDQAIACARNQNKPLFIDFTGHGCVNCREMEARVWSDPEVLKRLMNNFVMVALYVDDKKELPETEWYTSSYDGKVKKTIGKQNADLQITRFQNNAQPFYVILDKDENLLASPKAYDLDVQNFIKFLDEASANFNSSNSIVSN